MSAVRTVSVEFVDAVTGQPIARSDVPVDQLPLSFDVDTTVAIAGASWHVAHAQPRTKAEFRASGRLVLALRRAAVASSNDVLYSLPTLCDPLPAVDPATTGDDLLMLHEDDWRQVELVSAGFLDVVQAELASIRRVHDDYAVTGPDGAVVGFRSLHMRTGPVEPLVPPLPVALLHNLLPPAQAYAGVGFVGAPGAVIGSVAFRSGPFDLYGLAIGGDVAVLALRYGAQRPGTVDDTAAALADVMDAHTLTLVDWCRCAVVDLAAVSAYCRAMA